MRNLKVQQGFTLLEALIAMFLTAGAILGLGILHLKSIQQSQFSTQRMIANIQAEDLIDRMWANRCSLTSQTVKDNLVDDWNDHWDSTQAGEMEDDQKAMHQMLNGRSGALGPDDTNTSTDTDKDRYKILISWTNAKSAYKSSTDSNVTEQSFSYYFTLPKCATT